MRAAWLCSLLLASACAGQLAIEPGVSEPDGGHAPIDAARPRADAGRAIEIADDGVVRVAVLSDLNGSYGSTTYGAPVRAAVERIIALEPDLVLSTGDMVAGQRAGLDYLAMWRAFHEAVSDPIARAAIPFAVTPGNHDASGYSGYREERAIFVDEWLARPPEVELVDGAGYPLRYAFVIGPALFVSLDATMVGPLDDEQVQWLDAILVASDRPVKIVFGHVPLYPFAEGRETEHLGDGRLEELLVARGVDLFLSGHHHAFYPGRRGALRLVSMACVGAGPRPLIGGDGEPSSRSIVLLEIDANGIRNLDGMTGSEYDAIVDRRELPEEVGLPELRIRRDDL